MLKPIRLAAAAVLAAAVAACQTTGSSPPAASLALIEREGFTAQDAAVMNRNLADDDIRTTALYLCAVPRCGGLGLVAFGVEPPGLASTDEVRQLGRMSRQQAVRTAGKILRSAGLDALSVTNVAVANTPDGTQIITIDLRGRISGDLVHLRMTAAYRDGPGRMVAAASGRREVAARLGGRAMLGL
ncbi:MAG: hypothetical protein ACRCTI_16725 [Beijerinckiaceae bacterium]